LTGRVLAGIDGAPSKFFGQSATNTRAFHPCFVGLPKGFRLALFAAPFCSLISAASDGELDATAAMLVTRPTSLEGVIAVLGELGQPYGGNETVLAAAANWLVDEVQHSRLWEVALPEAGTLFGCAPSARLPTAGGVGYIFNPFSTNRRIASLLLLILLRLAQISISASSLTANSTVSDTAAVMRSGGK
jgi:hypothetical protein